MNEPPSAGSPQRDTLFRLVKARENSQSKKEPVYDDIFNKIFDPKTSKPQMLSEKNEARLKAIKKNFNFKLDMLRQQRLEKQMSNDFKIKIEKDKLEEERRASKRKRLALEARQFQCQQMEEKRQNKQEEINSQMAQTKKDQEEWEQLREKDIKLKAEKASKRVENQQELLKQAQERRLRKKEGEEMTQIEQALNSDILNPGEGVPSKLKHLPF